jgi:hypothetical protein
LTESRTHILACWHTHIVRNADTIETLFNGGYLSQALDHQLEQARTKVRQMPKQRVLEATEDELVAELVDEYRVEAPVFQMEQRHVSQQETQMDVRHEWQRAVHDRSRPALIPAVRVTMEVPFTGDGQVFKLRASTFSMSPPHAVIRSASLRVMTEFPRDSEPAATVLRQQLESQLASIEQQLAYARADIETFNQNLEGAVRGFVSRRRAELLADENRLAAFDLPVAGPPKPPTTYAVSPPARRRDWREQAPAETRRSHPPDPAMAQQDYEDLLGIIRDAARHMERTPMVYAGDNEEKRRHHIVAAINTHFPGSTYAEAFNGRGKTDILVRHDSQNLFIGECKVWSGPEDFARAIEQLLGYATYHDTKLALIVFVPGKHMTRAVDAGIKRLEQSPLVVGAVKRIGDAEARAIVTIADDADRHGQLHVLFFHTPAE